MTINEPIENIQAVLAERILPTITLFNRLEGRPRRADFGRSLRAEVRDALWMLCRQWQMGEFEGDDAGSPVLAKVHIATTRLSRYQADGHDVQPFDDAAPLEAVVEQRPVPLGSPGRPLALDLRLVMGRHWLKLVAPIGDLRAAFIARWPIARPDPGSAADAEIAAHPESYSAYLAVAGRAMDGGAFYQHLTTVAGSHPYDGLDVPLTPQQEADLDAAAQRYLAWFARWLYQPDDPSDHAWLPEHLEYQFHCSAPKGDEDGNEEKVLSAAEYYHGRLDWYNLDVDAGRPVLDTENPAPSEGNKAAVKRSFLPTAISFDGMPNTRWWAFEDGHTNFGDVHPNTTDISKLLLIEFGLVYANDWFLLPVTLPVGSVAQVRGLAVTNVFGERLWIEPAGRGAEQDWQHWDMYRLAVHGDPSTPSDASLLLLPTVPQVLEGPPLEEVLLIRDEMANMVWGIESRVPLPHGRAAPGREAAKELLALHQQIFDAQVAEGEVEPSEIEYQAAIRYQVMNTVPENWIPFIPVHVPGSFRATQLQRAALPRILEGAEAGDAEPVRPRTELLRHGLDHPEPQPYFVEEEEVSRAGARLRQRFQRTRWHGGHVYTWLGIRKATGRGEGSSGLAFDQILPTTAPRSP